MQDAYNRIVVERNLKEISRKELNSGWDAVDRVMKKVGNVKDWARTSVQAYDMLQQVMVGGTKKK